MTMPASTDRVTLSLTEAERCALDELGRQCGLACPENVIRVALFRMAQQFDLRPPVDLFQVRVGTGTANARKREVVS